MDFRIGLLVLAIVLSGCSPHIPSPDQQHRDTLRLTRLIERSAPRIDPEEARTLARGAVGYSAELARKYRVGGSPWFHNFLVNTGLRRRGLCYQWADDLYSRLSRHSYRTLRLCPVGANIGSYWSEHNALAVLPAGEERLTHAVLLDAWRGGGRLYAVPVLRDPKYRWSLRTDRGYGCTAARPYGSR